MGVYLGLKGGLISGLWGIIYGSIPGIEGGIYYRLIGDYIYVYTWN